MLIQLTITYNLKKKWINKRKFLFSVLSNCQLQSHTDTHMSWINRDDALWIAKMGSK